MRRICPNCQTATYDDSRRLCYACLHELGTSQREAPGRPESASPAPVPEPPVAPVEPVDVDRSSRQADVLRYEMLLRAERAARVALEDQLRKCERTLALHNAEREDTRTPDDRVDGDFAQARQGDIKATRSVLRVNRLLASALAVALVTNVAQAALPHFSAGTPKVAELLPVAAQKDCPVRTDPAGAPRTGTTTLWIVEGRKATDVSDALDADRSIIAACVARVGSEVTLQKPTRIWRGSNPGDRGDFVATERTLPPGATVKVVGALSGLSVSNGDGTFLHYEVWAPVETH